MKINAIIVDDEAKGRQNLRKLLQKYCPEVEVLAEAASAMEGLSAIKTHQPDLVFLDVEMPNGSGFDLLAHARPANFQVIFITAFDQYAPKAFEFAALHYVRKPIHPLQLVEAVKRYTPSLPSNPSTLTPSPATASSRKIVLPTLEGLDLIELHLIIKCEAEGSYTRFHFQDQPPRLYTVRLKEAEEKLPNPDFFRVHHSYVVNRAHINRYVKGSGGHLEMSDGATVPVSTRKKEEFLIWLRS